MKIEDWGKGMEMNGLSSVFQPREFQVQIGAEARIELSSWRGRPVISKTRIAKKYRSEDLDTVLRTRRTKAEVEIIHRAKIAGVRCPDVFFADPRTSQILMTYVEAPHLKDVQLSTNAARLSPFYIRVGETSGRLHKAGIIHGDFTTKNILVTSLEEDPVIIDFGLSFFSQRVEDRAEDLHLLEQAFLSTLGSQSSAKRAFGLVLEGYSSVVGKSSSESVKKQIAAIKLRGRYARVD